MENETNVADKQWFTNKQVIGFFGFFIAMGIGYSNFQNLLKDVEILKLEKEIMKADHRAEEVEMKSLIYTKAREGTEKTGRMVNPLRKDIESLKDWKNQEIGYQKALKELGK